MMKTTNNDPNNGIPMVYENEYCTIEYKEFKNGFTEEDSIFKDISHYTTGDFMVDDIINILNLIESDIDTFFVIYDVTTKEEYRNQGHGLATLKEFIEKRSNEFIAARIIVSKKHYPECPSEMEMAQIIEREFEFLEKVGFVDINGYCGLEYSIPCVYPNEKSKKFLEKFKDIVSQE